MKIVSVKYEVADLVCNSESLSFMWVAWVHADDCPTTPPK